MTWKAVFSNPAEPLRARALDIYQFIHRVGPYEGAGGYPTPHEISKRFGVSVTGARELDFVHTRSAGPGGKGEAWAINEITRMLKLEAKRGPLPGLRRSNSARTNAIVSGYDDPFYIVHGLYEDSRITDEFGSDDEAEALAAAKKLLRSPFFEGDIVRVMTRDGEFVWEQRR